MWFALLSVVDVDADADADADHDDNKPIPIIPHEEPVLWLEFYACRQHLLDQLSFYRE